MDVVIANEYGELFVYQNQAGTGTLAFQQTIQTIGVVSGLIAADVNHDGAIDLVYSVANPSSATQQIFVEFGDGAGGFSAGPSSAFSMGGEPAGALAIGDFDGASNVDILVLGA